MKRTLIALAVILALILPAQAQEKEEKLKELEKLEQKTEKVTVPDTLVYEPGEEIIVEEAEEEIVYEEEGEEYDKPDTSRVKIGDIITVEESEDETVIRIGKRAIRILTEDDDTEVRCEEYKDNEAARRRGRYFEGHLGGVEFGYNAYTTDQWGRNDGTLEGYLDLNTAKSSNFNIVAPPVSLGFTRHFGIVTGLGISFNNYRFDGNNSLTVDDGGIVAPDYPAEGINYDKSKLATVYGILPVMLEVQIPVTYSSTINLGAGVIGAVKLGSHTKTVYYDDGKQKDKNRDDFNLNVLRYGVTARAGYEMIQVYGTCYLSPMFEKNKGPELYPFEVGIALTIND
ncbi:MAG: outer membrane beta-barrel protein [Bacteroidales bacterium]